MNIFDFIKELVNIPTVSGYEYMGLEKTASIVNKYCNCFDEIKVNNVSGITFTKKCGIENAHKILLDAHIDTVGYIVSAITDEGFLKVVKAGGTDNRLLPSCRVKVYGKDGIYDGVFISVPPHLMGKDKDKKIDAKNCLYVDVGMDNKTCKEHIEIGNCITYFVKTQKLMNNSIVSAYLDDKICVAMLCEGIKNANLSKCDVVLNLSCGEETSGVGAKTAAFYKDIYCALVADVEFAKAPEISAKDCVDLGKGADVCYSASSDRALTDFVYKCAKDANIPVQQIVSAKSTGTNAHELQAAYFATPCAVLSVPIRNMHMPCEVANLDDVVNGAAIVTESINNAHNFKSPSCVIKEGSRI